MTTTNKPATSLPWIPSTHHVVPQPAGSQCAEWYRSCTPSAEDLLYALAHTKGERDQLVAAVKIAYTILGDNRHQWAGRNSMEGQAALCAMRDAIAQAEGREQQEVQDEYTNAALAQTKGAE